MKSWTERWEAHWEKMNAKELKMIEEEHEENCEICPHAQYPDCPYPQGCPQIKRKGGKNHDKETF